MTHNTGDNRYELTCENNVTVASLYSGKYYVQAINYNNFTIRLVDPGVQESNCSSIPRYFLSQSNFSDTYNFTARSLHNFDPFQAYVSGNSNPSYLNLLFRHIVYMNCSHPVIDPKYVDTTPCVNWHSKGYIYAIAGDLLDETFKVDCHVKLVAPTSWWTMALEFIVPNNISYTSIHRALVFGFQVSWLQGVCESHCGARSYCYFDYTNEKIECPGICNQFSGTRRKKCGGLFLLIYYVQATIKGILLGLFEIINGRNNEFEG